MLQVAIAVVICRPFRSRVCRLFVSLFGLMCVVVRKCGPQVVRIGVGLHSLWGLMYLASWVAGYSPRGHVTAVLYIAFVAMVLWGYGNTREVRLNVPREEHE